MNTLAEWLAWAEARSVRTEDGCLVWKQSLNGEQPQAGMKVDGKKVTVNVRRKLYEAKHPKAIPKAWVVMCKCDTKGCIEPEHLTAKSRSKMLTGRKFTAAHVINITLAARRRRTAKLTQEAVNDIRYGEGSMREKADRHGICYEYVHYIVNYRSWRDVGGPFSQLLAGSAR